MSDYQSIKLTQQERVATITLNEPKSLNAINQTMRKDLMRALTEIEKQAEIRVVVLTGEGRGFCAGADLSEGMPDYNSFVDQCAAEYEPWLMTIHNSSKLYLAAINGPCAGIGTALAMNCDLMIMAETAYLYQAFAAIGLIPDGGTCWLLVQKLGYSRALELSVNAGKLSAQDCLKLGITNRVVADERLTESAQHWAQEMSAGAPLAQQAVKQLMRKAMHMSYQEVIRAEAELQSNLLKSQDSQSAIQAFLNKQEAVFKGK